jgi:hypothetical protein
MATTLTMHRVLTIPLVHTEAAILACNDSAASLTCVKGAADTYLAAYEEDASNSPRTILSQYLRTWKSAGNDGATWVANPEVTILDHVPFVHDFGRPLFNRESGAKGNPMYSPGGGVVLMGGPDVDPESYMTYSGSVLRSADLGLTWQRVVSEALWNQYSMQTSGFILGPGPSDVTALGSYVSRDEGDFPLYSGGVSLVSHDGGATFTEVHAQISPGGVSVGVIVNPSIVAGGASGHVRTQDDGATWQGWRYAGQHPLSDPLRCLLGINGYVGNLHSRLCVFGEEQGEVQEDRGLVGRAIIGMAVHPSTNVVYACTSSGDAVQPMKLCTVNPLTGAVTIIGSLGVHLGDLAFTSAGVLYGISLETMSLYTVNLTTGAVTAVGVLTGLPAGTRTEDGGNIYDYDCGLTCDQATDTLYATPDDKHSGWKLYTVNKTTAACTLVATITGVSLPSGQWGGFSTLVMHPHGQLLGHLLYGSSYDSYWVTIDKATGVVHVLTFLDVTGVEALCYWTAPAAWPNGGPPPIPVFLNGCRALFAFHPLGGLAVEASFQDASARTTRMSSADGGATWASASGQVTA